MKLTQTLLAKLGNVDQERVRQNTDQRIQELQRQVQTVLTGTFVAIHVITTSSRYIPTKGATKAILLMVGGGGGGGGATAGVGVLSIGGGGASGITLVDLVTPLVGGSVVIGGPGSVTVGAGGGVGGDTVVTINGLVRTARGGGGGGAGTQNGNPAGSQGAAGELQAGSSAGLWTTGERGHDGLITSSAGGGAAVGSRGGSGALGAAIFGGPTGFGAGGRGGSVVNGSVAGAVGTAGVAIFIELS